MKHVEIERKWIVDGFPEGEPASESYMEQGYLALGDNTVRIRRAEQNGQTVSRILCIKGKGTLQRTEVELPLTEEQYIALVSLLKTPLVGKLHRTYILPDGEILECNLVDEGAPTSFYYAEVEFDSAEAAHAFVPMPYLRHEVTNEPGWTMADYCRQKNKE